MTLSHSAAYAISAVAYIAAQRDGRRCGVQEISGDQQIPICYLGKILQALRRRGLLRAARGIGGGYQLAIPAERIRLINIVDALGENIEPDRCLLRCQGCTGEDPCLLHHRWAGLRRQFNDMLATTTIADLISEPSLRPESARKKGEPA